MSNPVEKTNRKGKEAFQIWLFFNILLPLAPNLFKVIVLFFSNTKGIIVFESSDLLYYTFFICIMMAYSIILKESKLPLELPISFVAFFVVLINTVLIGMIYAGIQYGQRIHAYSIAISVLVVVVACLNKYREVKQL